MRKLIFRSIMPTTSTLSY